METVGFLIKTPATKENGNLRTAYAGGARAP